MDSIKIHLKPYLAEFYSIYYTFPMKVDLVKLPPSSEFYVLLLNLLKPMPPHPNLKRDFNLSIILPNRSGGKRSSVYNYLSVSAEEQLGRWAYTFFWSTFHRYVFEMTNVKGFTIQYAVECFKGKYQIDALSDDAFVKHYYRWKKNIKINLKVQQQNNTF